MIRKNDQGIYFSTLLTELGIHHGYSSRKYGDLRVHKNRNAFLEKAGVHPADVVTGQQVHGIRVRRVSSSDKGKEMAGIDALTASYISGSTTGLGVTFADCVPILAVDPVAHVIGTAHAGWKGTYAGVASELIAAMKKLGADTGHIYISIGPHIGMCCYNVTEDRVMIFRKIFGSEEKITSRIQGSWHMDIGFANFRVLLDSGVMKDHIDAPPICTSCQVSEFNSYRKDPKDAFGLQLGVIAI